MVEVRTDPTITIEKDNSKVILTIVEAAEVKQLLDDFLAKYADSATVTSLSNRKPANTSILKEVTATPVHMSEDKKKQLRDHVLKKLTAEPQSLTTLLKGVSYVPNYLPFIRDMIEQDDAIGVYNVGKRAMYYKKGKEAKAAS